MGGFQRPSNPHLRNQITRLRSQNVGSQEFIRIRIKNHFDESLTTANGQRFATGAKRKTADTDRSSGLACRLFGHPYTGDLWLAVGAARDIVVGYTGIVDASNGFDGRNAFSGSLVSQTRRTIDITNSVDARHVRTAVRINGDKAALTAYASRL